MHGHLLLDACFGWYADWLHAEPQQPCCTCSGELSSLEEALGALLTSGQLRSGVVKALWAVAAPACQRLAASGGADEAARREARGAFAVLAAASDGHPQHVATNLGLLIQVMVLPLQAQYCFAHCHIPCADINVTSGEPMIVPAAAPGSCHLPPYLATLSRLLTQVISVCDI